MRKRLQRTQANSFLAPEQKQLPAAKRQEILSTLPACPTSYQHVRPAPDAEWMQSKLDQEKLAA